MRRLKLKSLRAGLGPMSAEIEVVSGERELLHPLFVVLRDKRALLDAPHGREDSEYVTQSIETVREELTTALKSLGPDSSASSWLEILRKACREYLDAVAQVHMSGDGDTDFAPALTDLRMSFREIANYVGDRYDLPVARDLVQEMSEADELAAGSTKALEGSVVETLEPAPDTPVNDEPTPAPGVSSSRISEVLVAALDDRDDMVRFQAMASLGDHLTPTLLPAIEPLLNDRDNDIRRYALEYYARLAPS
jgi:hypothetical protein